MLRPSSEKIAATILGIQEDDVRWINFDSRYQNFHIRYVDHHGVQIAEIPARQWHNAVDLVPKTRCQQCRYYSGQFALPCAVHPTEQNGGKDCPDWEGLGDDST